ncbi:Anaphase-promoting complex subunit 4 [Penicillium chermesinum]|nr:Anaphase-promoting complex subunit 4 [Penicillium chermesinum]
MEEGPHLTPVGEKSLPAKCKLGTLAYCPTMDLIALATEDEELHVFRLNGQKVFGGSFGGDPYLGEDEEDGEVRAVAWKGNGRLLAVACGDGSLRIISAYTGKTVHHYPIHRDQSEDADEEQTAPKVTCLGWGLNFTDSKAMYKHLVDSTGQVSLEDLLAASLQPSKAAAMLKADLPGNSQDDLFSSRASIDAIFHSSAKDTSDSVDVLFVGFDDGSVHLRIFDCFEIGSFSIRDDTAGARSRFILCHASHPFSSTHAMLASSGTRPESPDAPIDLVTLDLRFITKSGRYLSLLASKTTQLQNLLRYIGSVQRQIELEWKNAQELPARFLRGISEDLQEKCQDTRDGIRLSVGGYENIRRLTHECLLPALERSQVLLGRLVGLSKFSKLGGILGLDTPKLNAIIETLDCLHILAHNILIHTNEELRQFMAFSRWLHHEIMILNSEPFSQTSEELLEKRDIFDVPLTVKYITGALRKSVLRSYIRQLPMLGVPQMPTPATDKWVPDGHDRSFYDTFKSLLEQQRHVLDEGGDVTTIDAPKLNDLTKRLGLQFDKVFAEIALTQRRGILHHSPLTLHADCERNIIDLNICYDSEGGEEGHPCSIYIASRSKTSKSLIYVYRTVLDTINGVSSTRSTSMAALDLQEGEVRQLQFFDHGLMVLWAAPKSPARLLDIPFQPILAPKQPNVAPAPAVLDFTTIDSPRPSSQPSIQPTCLSAEALSKHGMVRHEFAVSGSKSRPVRLNFYGRKGRKAVCVLYGDAMRYEVLDLDAATSSEDDEDEAEG